MREIPDTKVRDILEDLLNEVIYRGEEVVILRRGRPVAKLVAVTGPKHKGRGGARGIEDDPLYKLVGAGKGMGHTDVTQDMDEVVYGR